MAVRVLFSIWLCFFVLCQPSEAGSRGLSIAFVDATVGERSKEGLRLAKLLEADMREVYVGVCNYFPWSEPKVDLTVLQKENLGCRFDRLLNGGKVMAIRNVLEKHHVSDGLIVYYYDRAHGCARLKLFDVAGSERMLIRLPLEQTGSAMQYSLLKHTRRGALTALGCAVVWSP